MKPDVVAISGELSHQISSASDRRGPPWKTIAKVEKSVIRNRVEVVLAINEASESLLDNLRTGPGSPGPLAAPRYRTFKPYILRSREVAAIKVHPLVPGRHKVTHERLLRVAAGIDFRESSQLGV